MDWRRGRALTTVCSASLPQLPHDVVTDEAWLAYVRRVYHQPVAGGAILGLRNFSWFYLDAPDGVGGVDAGAASDGVGGVDAAWLRARVVGAADGAGAGPEVGAGVGADVGGAVGAGDGAGVGAKVSTLTPSTEALAMPDSRRPAEAWY